ncbi:bifunctional 3'-5' exonuclease/DNA polymerase [Kocuria sp.]|uniref:bifunctional 3'-5' exonuclease/DNA polymerase n=1 Tax=Kocuria sp. TaxID=1871328 RepID=UPI0026E09A85|nr:bifunctional 3'-5' exonuclease/DNA polymerase [Kocuria sp.]MDO5618568.1 bifunctional 3'-5' exonuclease/DNA polymerase [Kocuria sp.]
MFVVVVPSQGLSTEPGDARTTGGQDAFLVQDVDARGNPTGAITSLSLSELTAFIRNRARTAQEDAVAAPRWVFERSVTVFPQLLSQDPAVPLTHVHDLRLVQNILQTAADAPGSGVVYQPVLTPLPQHEHPGVAPPPPVRSAWNSPAQGQLGLFDSLPASGTPAETSPPPAGEDLVAPVIAELAAQWKAITNARSPQKLALLAALESTGALLAADMHRVGIAWDTSVHRSLLEDALGPEPAPQQRPAKMETAARAVQTALTAPTVNPDSPQSLLRALRAAGVPVDSTSQWLLTGWVQAAPASSPGERERRQAMIGPVLEYKKMSRLLTANGWHWLENWVRADRFHAEYVVGGVVTGRWAARGGGALQIPKVVRSAVRPGPDRKLVVADAAQLEPRVLAVLARDQALAEASRGRDLYLSIAEQGRARSTELTERNHAKVALLGAMYGATTGDSGRLMPQLTRMFPKAVAYVEHAARVGERGGQVCTWLGRWSPAPDEQWMTTTADTATASSERRARSMRRTHGRFTRNFVVQGSAAEWAMAWMGRIRTGLKRAHLDADLVFFLHDEIMVDTAAKDSQRVEDIVRAAADEAARIVFGPVPVEFPVTVVTVDSYDQAK